MTLPTTEPQMTDEAGLPRVSADRASASMTGSQHQDAVGLRAALVTDVAGRLQRAGLPLPGRVEAALRTVPRHLFTPGIPVARAYENTAIITKANDRGVNVSSVSAPSLIAAMLAQLDVQPGHCVLELGSGGYNAALLRELTGPGGSVTSLDIDPEVTGRARACLDAAGYEDVRTVCADGEFGAREYAPFDRIIMTMGVWDIPPSLTDQLAEGGRIVAPLRTRGLTRSWVLEREGDHLAGRDHWQCGFVPVQGAGEHRGRSALLHDTGVGLWIDEDTPFDESRLAGVLDKPRAEAWSGVTMAIGESSADQDLWLAALPDFCLLTASQDALDQGVVALSWRYGTPALTDGDSIAYRARPRPLDDQRTVFEAGAYGHGPHGAALAERLAGQIRAWDRQRRTGAVPLLTVNPASTAADELHAGPGRLVLRKRHTTIVLTWVAPAA
jgi:protein-L-isoaspartate(D-aspartate) O-methyltransferase